MILCPILNENDGLSGLRQDTPEKGNVSRGVEAAFLPLIQEAPAQGINEAKDLVAFTLACGFDLGLLAAPRPRVGERAPLRERRFIAKQQQGLPFLGTAQYLWPCRGAPSLPFGVVKLIGDKRRFLIAQAPVLQQLGNIEDVVEDPKAIVN